MRTSQKTALAVTVSSLLSGGPALAEGLVILSGVAWHPNHEQEYKWFTPGLSYRSNNLEVGAYSNSFGHLSTYFGYVGKTPIKDLGFIVGGVTGYQIPLAPALVLVYQLDPNWELLVIPPIKFQDQKADMVITVRYLF